MKQLLLPMLLGAALLTGCASHYVVMLNNGQRLMAVQKPQLKGFNFVFTDLNGRTNSVPSTNVRAIVPASNRTPAK
jgi:uncharacterized protein YcfL